MTQFVLLYSPNDAIIYYLVWNVNKKRSRFIVPLPTNNCVFFKYVFYTSEEWGQLNVKDDNLGEPETEVWGDKQDIHSRDTTQILTRAGVVIVGEGSHLCFPPVTKEQAGAKLCHDQDKLKLFWYFGFHMFGLVVLVW